MADCLFALQRAGAEVGDSTCSDLKKSLDSCFAAAVCAISYDKRNCMNNICSTEGLSDELS